MQRIGDKGVQRMGDQKTAHRETGGQTEAPELCG
jgi:hypothetical protein